MLAICIVTIYGFRTLIFVTFYFMNHTINASFNLLRPIESSFGHISFFIYFFFVFSFSFLSCTVHGMGGLCVFFSLHSSYMYIRKIHSTSNNNGKNALAGPSEPILLIHVGHTHTHTTYDKCTCTTVDYMHI